MADKTLRLILGDQLNHQHSWYDKVDTDTTYLLMEMRQETDYTKHHIQKIVAFFSSMRSFADQLTEQGHQVIYYRLDHESNKQDLTLNVKSLIEDRQFSRFEYQMPDEYRLDRQLVQICEQLSVPTEVYDTEHFLTERGELEVFFAGKKTYLMESFYRSMRRKYDIMMDGNQPETGQWNYDADNRKKLPKGTVPPPPKTFDKEVSDIKEMIDAANVTYIGNINAKAFIWPTTRQEGLDIMDYFCKHMLANFGNYQDALTPDFWSLYHSRISFAMNAKLISPLEVVNKAISAWRANPDVININQIEGFVRQIIGWREYMRGIYWAKMPDYSLLNFFNHERKLPKWFWTGKTDMRCMSHAIEQSLDYAYAHHIQRLMVTGNFALLAGIHPDEIDQWYLGIYIDAIEWVEITNTRGMSQFADGGIVGTKPYVSSANYIDKMSHYCNGCKYDKKDKTGANSCPFNSLYWHFYARNEDKLAKNPRIGMMYRTWAKMTPEKQKAYLDRAEYVLDHIEDL